MSKTRLALKSPILSKAPACLKMLFLCSLTVCTACFNDEEPPPGTAQQARLLSVDVGNPMYNNETAFLDSSDDIDTWLQIPEDGPSQELEAGQALLMQALEELEEGERLIAVELTSGGCGPAPFKFRGFYQDGTDINVWVSEIGSSMFGGLSTCPAIFVDFYYFAVQENQAERVQIVLNILDPNLPMPDFPEDLNR